MGATALHPVLVSLFGRRIGSMLHAVNVRRLGLRVVPGLGRRLPLMATVARSVKLEHRAIDKREAGTLFEGFVPRFRVRIC